MRVYTVHEVLESTQNKLAEVIAERDALAAQVEGLRSEIEYSATAIIERNPSGEIHAIACSMMETAKATPQQHLAEIRAEAGRDGFVAALTAEMDIGKETEAADRYADSIRQEVK